MEDAMALSKRQAQELARIRHYKQLLVKDGRVLRIYKKLIELDFVFLSEVNKFGYIFRLK